MLTLRHSRRDCDKGSTAVEYGLLVSGVVAGCIGMVALLGNVAHTVLSSEQVCVSVEAHCSTP